MPIIDLKALQADTFDITLVNGDVMNVKQPSQEKLMTFSETSHKIKKLQSEGKQNELLDAAFGFLNEALSYNKQGIIVNQEWFESQDVGFVGIMTIFTKYSEWLQGELSDPNL